MDLSIAAKLVTALATDEGKTEFKELWDRLDKDGDGKVSGAEWGKKVWEEKAIMSKYFGGSTMAEIGTGFNRIDSNGDGQLTWDEFTAEVESYKALKQLKEALQSEEGKVELKKLFDTLDKDGDGKITGAEWGHKVFQEKEVMAKFFGGTDMASIGKGFNRIDSDGDDSLTWDEFTAAVGGYIL
mmetsp:Transcript_27417/g.58663  ORF Transcript_27417/g.58663 Transcript_27417/m.58663 type:complete len:184 (+) Transcript_27417:302-853(+)|eukprot:CAMPEP_0201125348 /NCGR_PEP_ID=MMETSP0850-20130426/20858_1 /ASSEMBLY_ACC=CAM_ASM_000622 /TAXON_ID=183588 /ORGANISM="Pseudo-nitzschia fraudulenta, Strain WWA7" /LENGTH=183 /DNA_ID=CAMNT_0047393325 /DNA_START=310 /DNA_END=861 /DNA_ORIENTATION=+